MPDAFNTLLILFASVAVVLLCMYDPCRIGKSRHSQKNHLLMRTAVRRMLWLFILFTLIMFIARGNSSDLIMSLSVLSLLGWVLTRIFMVEKK